MTRRLVLASASAARLATLRASGFAPDVVVSGVDESDVTGSPVDICLELAQRKARGVAAATPDALVVGCDSVLEFGGQAYGKPLDAADVLDRWARMAGNTGTLHTGHCVVDTATGKEAAEVSSTLVRFGTPTAEELDAYIASGEPLAVAGAFTIDGLGAQFVDAIDGDPGTVIGISLPLLRKLLADLGTRATDLWTR
ncbi:MAG TPA: nucleoside triphosphate pyrophosphatase [Cryptosporangiaceae bacterium]|nr:nucleoside triphosphate pyrophosphatase [Cryptosporangiaceae bacterium]